MCCAHAWPGSASAPPRPACGSPRRGCTRRAGDTLQRLRLDPYVDFFRGEHLGFAPTAEAVARWWDLAAIAKEHEAFLDRHARVLHDWERRTDTPAEEAYHDYLLALDTWRHLPYADPGLPAGLLPRTGRAPARPRCSGGCTSGCGTRGPPSRAYERFTGV